MIKRQFLRAILCSTLIPLLVASAPDWREIDFDTSMQIAAYPKSVALTRKVIGIDGIKLLNYFRTLYTRFNNARKLEHQHLKIPKIIHHIWLGSPLPESLKQYVETWREKHGPTWEYRLWTEQDIKTLGLYNQQFYDETDNYGTKSDIARLEILYRFGGLYVDTDFECLESLDYLHYVCDFYTGLQPLDTYFVQLGSALIGSIPEHPILKHCIETVKDDWHLKGAPAKTGPIHCTKAFISMAGHDGRVDVALPATYFYPLGSTDHSETNYAAWRSLGALAIHHWSKTWMPATYRPQKFKNIDNYTSTVYWNK